MFSEKEMTQALKYQELMFQERLLKKDQDYMKEQDKLREEAEAWRAKFEHLGGLYEQQENTMMMLKRQVLAANARHNEQIVSAIERHVLGKKKDTDEKTASLQKITKERDQLAGDLHNMEIAFADFHRRYEKAKQAISTLKENESILKQQLADYREGVEKSNQMFNLLKAKTEESLEGASKEIEDSKKNFQADITVLRGQLKKAEMDNSCLEKRLEQKTEENAQLAKLYDDLLSQVKAK
ncbi:transforming acidic coiled-coil containing protein, putative [Ixodes scapularis]|uniref:Transforming acidic coiled-coil containing protein, putative n=1 Tax=Ixodes scapularis TaxID=6945 RepID=B7PAA1_IXOSC|nr:transforming acidic coiled-coil containing protein, putative [Ixodes scapularis]|eukprot:XP_002406670.1 transforming acidic coiled-coil containing protein, putative [Ixodes scapularis]